MFVKAFADLHPLNLRLIARNYQAAWICMFLQPMWSNATQNFFEHLIERCNWRTHAALSCHVQAKQTTLVKYKPPFTIKLEDLMLALIVAQFGPRHFPDIGPPEPTAAETRYFQSCAAFVQALGEVLAETGVSEDATCKSISQSLADRVRFLVVEVGEARKAFYIADAPNQYARVCRKLETLLALLHGDMVPERAWSDRIELAIYNVMEREMTPEQRCRFVWGRLRVPL